MLCSPWKPSLKSLAIARFTPINVPVAANGTSDINTPFHTKRSWFQTLNSMRRVSV